MWGTRVPIRPTGGGLVVAERRSRVALLQFSSVSSVGSVHVTTNSRAAKPRGVGLSVELDVLYVMFRV